MSGALPRRSIHSGPGISADRTTDAPRGSSVMGFFVDESSAERTPWAAARSNSVGASTRSALSMYSPRLLAWVQVEIPRDAVLFGPDAATDARIIGVRDRGHDPGDRLSDPPLLPSC